MIAASDIETVGPEAIPVRIRRSARAKRLTLRMAAATGEISLTVPRWTTRRTIRGFLEDHHWWIESRRQNLPTAITPQVGTELSVLGTPLGLVNETGRRVRRDGAALSVPGLTDNPDRARTSLRGWLREAARAHAAKALDAYADALGRPYKRLTMRDPRTRWGSCSSEGNIMLSWRLALAPVEVFDYVAAHEAAHLVEMNHSAAYWRQVARVFPDYKKQRAWLRQNGAALHRIAI